MKTYVISFYGQQAFQKFLLPPVNNADYEIVLYSDIFGIQDDLSLLFENMEGFWRVPEIEGYSLIKGKDNYFGCTIRENDIVQLRTEKGDKLTMLVYSTATPFEVYRKYSLENLRHISIGKTPSCDICYDYFGLVSSDHAHLIMTDRGCILQDRSSNGTFINNVRVDNEQILYFGDRIHILGLQMIYLGDLLAIEQESSSVVVNEHVLHRMDGSSLGYFAVDPGEEIPEKSMFHRTPRNIEKIETEPIEIEDPPAPQRQSPQSMLLAVGPAFSMALPMVLGTFLTSYGSTGNTLAMIGGLVTTLSSAVIGGVWAAANIKSVKKQSEKDEKERKDAYVKYLEKSRSDTRETYDRNSRILQARYPSAQECASFGKDTMVLWNRNQHHTDFLYHRIGLGRIPFQAPILIPKRRFQVHPDELADIPQEIKSSFETMKDVPVGMDFTEHRLTGIVGGEHKIGALTVARDLLIQIAAANCYTDVKLAVIYRKENGYEEQYLGSAKWLPHTWSMDKKTRYVASTREEAEEVFFELTKVFRTRDEESRQTNKEQLPRPYYVLFITDTHLLEDTMITKYIFSDDKRFGVSVVLLAETPEELPNTCEFIIQNDSEFQGYFMVTDDISDRVPVKFDTVSSEQFEQFARRLSDIQVNEVERGGEIPGTLTFFEMMGVKTLAEMDVLSNWKKNRTYDSMKALVGVKAGGVPCYLDIHEKYHGPHGLVAGTTGSGKSETLQTYILSLAVNFSPDDVGFFVIDYKGGGMANLFTDLPHTIGQISNLSGNQVRRAMVSIKSENRRRQQLFNEHGVNNINSYTKLVKNNEASTPIPHLFIIIDEFAELKREEPEFMHELISVAQVGRSLGVHLILATQKPSGTVDDNIWSNSKFRLCLRVQDRQDSTDMLHKPDAAYITQAGRCYLQVGNDEIFELFQSGWSGAVYDEAEGSVKTEIARMTTLNGKAALVGNHLKIRQKEEQKRRWITEIVKGFDTLMAQLHVSPIKIPKDARLQKQILTSLFDILNREEQNYPYSEYNYRRLEEMSELYAKSFQEAGKSAEEKAEWIIAKAIEKGQKLPEGKEKTQLDAVVEYLSQVAQRNGYNNDYTLWLPPLSTHLYLDELKGYSQVAFDGKAWPKQTGKWKLEAFMGQIDDPVNQAQMPLVMSLSEGGHHAICGTVVTGKSTFLQTFVYSLSHSYSPDYVNFYLLDFSSQALGPFADLPHVGGIIFENDLEKIGKFFNMIEEIVSERKKLLQGGNYEQYVQTHGVTIPAIVIVIDQFSNFTEKTEGIYEENLIRLSRTGTGYGIYLVCTAAGFGMNEIPNRIGDNIRTLYSLEMNDKYQYADILHTMQIPVLPEAGVKGRGLVNRDGDILEFQTALSLEAEDDYTRSEKIVQECRRMAENWEGKCARKIPEIPENPVFDNLYDLESTQSAIKDPRLLPLGYNSENASVYSIDLCNTFTWLVIGKTRSGKTNVLRILMRMAKEKGADVALFDTTNGLKGFAQRNSIRYIGKEEELVNYWMDMVPDIQKRNAIKKEAREQELDIQEIFNRMSDEKAYFLFIDEISEFIKMIYQPENADANLQPFLENITEKAWQMQIYLIAAYDPTKQADVAGYKVFENLCKAKTGIHLGGNVSDQQILDFDYIPFTEQAKLYKPGFGQLPSIDGEVPIKSIVIPLDKAAQTKITGETS